MNEERAFWEWFRQNEEELMNFEKDREKTFDRISSRLGRVHRDLTFEFGPRRPMREFIISAGGVSQAFAAVSRLAAAAPKLDRWRIVAFRPRRAIPSIVVLGEKHVDSRNVQFSLLDDSISAGIYLYIPGFRENDNDLKQIGYLILDDALGEFDVEQNSAS